MEAAVQKEVAGTGAKGTGETLLQQLSSALSDGRPAQQQQLADAVLREMRVYFKSEAVLAACTKLQEDLHKEKEASEESQLMHWHDVIEAAAKAVQSAHKPADLDDTLRELGDAGRRSEYNGAEVLRAAASQIQSARQFVVSWQDYLASSANGDLQNALQELQNAAGANAPNIMPRSVILGKIEELKSKRERALPDRADAIVEQIKTLDEISGGVLALQALPKQNTGGSILNPNDIPNLISALSTLAVAYNGYQVGMPTTANSFLQLRTGGMPTPNLPGILNLQAQLLRLILPRQLGIDGALRPRPTEAIQDYLQRILDDAQERCDARLILHVRQVQMFVIPNSTYPTPAGTEALLAAQNQEQAEQYVPAVISYENALKIGGDLAPALAIGKRLEAIKAAHPADYAQGLQIFLAQPKPAIAPNGR